jgi:hypothetical protein
MILTAVQLPSWLLLVLMAIVGILSLSFFIGSTSFMLFVSSSFVLKVLKIP